MGERTRSKFARRVFAGWCVMAGVLGLVVYFCWRCGCGPGSGWEADTGIQFFELVVLLGLAPVIHWLDKRQRASGFRDYFYRPTKTSFELDDTAIRGLLTVQSIRSALTLGVLLALLANRERLLGGAIIRWPALLHSPDGVFYLFAVVGLAGSALTTLVSIQSYDYALRFSWNDKMNVKETLIKKAHWLGVMGFYCLMWSLTSASELGGPLVGLVVTSAVFFVLWYYYFFPTDLSVTSAERLAPQTERMQKEATPSLNRDTPVSDSEKLEGQWPLAKRCLNSMRNHVVGNAQSDIDALIAFGDAVSTRPPPEQGVE